MLHFVIITQDGGKKMPWGIGMGDRSRAKREWDLVMMRGKNAQIESYATAALMEAALAKHNSSLPAKVAPSRFRDWLG